MSPRRDVAVVLARGRSRRMGRPKGLCRLPDDPRCFLARIAALYAALELPLAVVTTPSLQAGYERALRAEGPGRPVLWIARPGGGGTAATVAAALREVPDATHLWLHPVDVPAVAVATLRRLRRLSGRRPRAALVPVWEGRSGHPVLLPAAPFAARAGSPPPGAMRDWLRAVAADAGAGLALVEVAVGDPGVATDYDDPASLRGRG